MVQTTCRQCNQAFEVTNADLVFYEKVSPVFKGKKELIPSPTLCSECRNKRRMAWRNDRKFYNRKCDATGEEIFSMYKPNTPFPVYQPKSWYSDNWDPMKYGLEIDWTRPFWEQYYELQSTVPRLGIDIVNCENCEYCNYCGDNKNCYLDIAGEGNEDCYYNLFVKHSKNCVDNTFVYNSTLAYESIQCYESYNVGWSMFLDNCADCFFCFDLKGCKNCLFSHNLRNQEYRIFNKPVSKEEYEKILHQLKTGSHATIREWKQKWLEYREKNAVCRNMVNLNTENCFGDGIKNSKNCFAVYNVSGCEDSKYLNDVLDATDCQDLNYSLYKPELAYELISTLSMKYSAFNMASHYCHNVFYCDLCNNSSNLFACIGLNHKQYCIFNKQYTKEEYEELVPRIIESMKNEGGRAMYPSAASGTWGEFFDPKLSPFGYNETVAQEYYPLSREEALQKGFNWSDYVSPPPKVDKIIKANQLPDSIDQIPDDILNWAIECEVSGKPYKIIKQELQFYRDHRLPIPRRHPDQRHLDRMKLRNPRKLFQRKCDQCQKEIQTTYAPERPERVYCEECYLKEVY